MDEKERFGKPQRDESLDVLSLAGLSNDDSIDDETDEILDESGEVIAQVKHDGFEQVDEQPVITPVRKPVEAHANIYKIEEDEKKMPSPDSGALSPLEQMKQNKTPKGIVASTDTIKEAMREKKPETTDETINRTVAEPSLKEADEMMAKRKMVVLTQPIDGSNRLEVAELMDEIESVVIRDDGTAYFDYKDKNEKPITPRLVRLRTANDLTWEEEQEYMRRRNEKNKQSDEKYEDGTPVKDEPERFNYSMADLKNDKRKDLVQIIIDKTGYGDHIEFTDEEKEKIRTADEILVKSVKVLDINSARVKKPTKGFKAGKAYKAKSDATTVVFPASGFRAQMLPLSYGEIGDIITGPGTMTFDSQRKRFSVIYNKMVNISCGEFESFDDFLNKFSYLDMEMAIYGLIVSSLPEVSYAMLLCGNPKCANSRQDRGYEVSYHPRELLKLEYCTDKFLERMNTILGANEIEARRIARDSVVRNPVQIELPESKYIAEIAPGNAYHYLNNCIPAMKPEYLTKRYGENSDYSDVNFVLPYLLAFYVPDVDDYGNPTGDYEKYDNYDDILSILDVLNLDDARLVTAVITELLEAYTPIFTFDNVECPLCHRKETTVSALPSVLVFQSYQRQMGTRIDVSSVLNF